MQNKKGFTIIELLVVIAIIAVLAAIVLVNVTQYIAKGKNAAIEGNMATLLTNGAAYFDENSSQTGSGFAADTKFGCGGADAGNNVIGTSPIAIAIKNAYGSADLTCVGDATSAAGGTGTQAWCGFATTIAVGTTPPSTFCVDSTGYKGTLGTDKCTGTTYTCQ